MDKPLFRKEVLERRRNVLHGDINLAMPMSWQAIGYLLLFALVVALIFLASASYARVETVSGAIVLDKGVVPIVPSRPGILVALSVREGDRIRAGAPLAVVRSEEDQARGTTAPRQTLEALAQQDRRLSVQAASLMGAAEAEKSRLAARIDGLNDELASLDAQIVDQKRLVAVAEDEFRDVQQVVGRGFISRRDLNAREAALVTRRQQLSQLRQARAGKTADLAGVRRAVAEATANAAAKAAEVESSRFRLVQEGAQAEAAQGYSLTSPVDGMVTALTARVGQPAAQGQPLMIVLPAGARVGVDLYVPTKAAGFLARGQEVRLAVDAFPSQQFGTVAARITSISTVAISKTAGDGGAVPVYLATAELERPWILAFGRKQPLLPGMALTARIVTRRQSLFEWLFEPIFAVNRR